MAVLICTALISMVSSCAVAPDAEGPAAREPTASEGAARKPAAVSVQHFETAQLKEHAWGWIRWLINSEIDPEAEMTFGVVQLNAHERNPLHVHYDSEEHLYVLSGSCEHRLGDTWVTLEEGDLMRIPAGVPHMARTREEPMRAVIVYSSGTRDFSAVEESDEGEEEAKQGES
jgi:quercetin dioxygenase-like cupin family protein